MDSPGAAHAKRTAVTPPQTGTWGEPYDGDALTRITRRMPTHPVDLPPHIDPTLFRCFCPACVLEPYQR